MRNRGYENLDAYTVPPEFWDICFTNYENLGFQRSETFYQGRTTNCEYFFLKRELNFLQNLTCFMDGTFFLVKNVIHTQVYIISVNITNLALDTTFSYSIFFCLMRKKSSECYNKKFILDNEQAVYKNLKELYLQTPISLCRVHLLRSWRKKSNFFIFLTNF